MGFHHILSLRLGHACRQYKHKENRASHKHINMIQIKRVFDRIPNGKILHVEPHLFAILYSNCNRSQGLCDASNELLNTHKIPIDS